MKYVAFICFYITMNVICYGGYSMSTILFFIFIDFIFYLLVQCANSAIPLFAPPGPGGARLARPGLKKKEGLPQSLFYIIILY